MKIKAPDTVTLFFCGGVIIKALSLKVMVNCISLVKAAWRRGEEFIYELVFEVLDGMRVSGFPLLRFDDCFR